jgi:hypothetical protein
MRAIWRSVRTLVRRGRSRWRSRLLPSADREGTKGFETYTNRPRLGKSFELVIDAASDDPIVRLYREGYHENQHLTTLLTRFTGRRGRVLDLGAHIGTFALAAAALGREVLAVDAAINHVALLRQSAARNGYDRMKIVHAAVSDRPGTVYFHEANLWGMVAYPGLDAPMVEVNAITVDALLEQVG